MKFIIAKILPFKVTKIMAAEAIQGRSLFLIMFIAIAVQAQGIVVEREWETTVTLPATIGWNRPEIIEHKDRTFLVFKTTDYKHFVILLDENHNQIWTSKIYSGWVWIRAFEKGKFILEYYENSNRDIIDAIFFEERNGEIIVTGNTSDFQKPDETMISGQGFGGLSDVAEHEDFSDARFKELDTTCNYRTISVTERSGLTKIRVRHYLFSGDSARQEPVIAPVLMSGFSGKNFIVKWNSEVGKKYRVQVSGNLETWNSRVPDIDGNGALMQWGEPVAEDAIFVRLLCID